MTTEKLTFEIQLNDGVVRWKAIVPALESGLVGCYSDGKPYEPNDEAILERLPFKYRKAFRRASKWWQESDQSGRFMPLKCELTTLRGKPLGTLWATPDWVL